MTDDMIQLGKINYSSILTGCLINVENLFKNTSPTVYGFNQHFNGVAAGVANTEKQYNERQQRIQPDHHSGRVYPAVLSTNNLFYCEKTEFFFTTGLNTLSTTKTTYCTNSFEYKQIPDKPA
jgi:hypothetical protein